MQDKLGRVVGWYLTSDATQPCTRWCSEEHPAMARLRNATSSFPHGGAVSRSAHRYGASTPTVSGATCLMGPSRERAKQCLCPKHAAGPRQPDIRCQAAVIYMCRESGGCTGCACDSRPLERLLDLPIRASAGLARDSGAHGMRRALRRCLSISIKLTTDLAMG